MPRPLAMNVHQLLSAMVVKPSADLPCALDLSSESEFNPTNESWVESERIWGGDS